MIRIFHMESVAGNTVETKHCKNPMVSRLSNKYLLLIELLSESYSSMLDVLSSRRSAVRYHDILPHVGAAKPPDSQPPPATPPPLPLSSANSSDHFEWRRADRQRGKGPPEGKSRGSLRVHGTLGSAGAADRFTVCSRKCGVELFRSMGHIYKSCV